MDETTYEVSVEHNNIRVLFDLRTEENCFIGLTFSEDDALAIINMKHLGQNKIPLKSIGGNASLGSGKPSGKNICLAYKNGNTGTGTVFYPYEKLTLLLSQAFSELLGS
jgi:hypothetical protein